MAVRVTLYTFAKKINSTAQPADGTGVDYMCTLKSQTDLIAPAIELKVGADFQPTANYAYIRQFNRFYHIENWSYDPGLWTAQLRVDALASWKTEIGASTQYVARAASAPIGDIDDHLYPMTDDVDNRLQLEASPWQLGNVLTTGKFVLAVTGTTTEFYVLDGEQLERFMNGLFSDAYAAKVLGDTWATIFPELKARLNPLQYVTSCRWFPLADIPGTELVDQVPVGWGSVTAFIGRVAGTGVVSDSIAFDIPRHPQAATRGGYLNSTPYSSYSLYFPPFGVVQLDAALVKSADTVRADWFVDVRTGDGILKVYYITPDGEILAGTVGAKVALDFALGQIMAATPGLTSLLLGSGAAGSAVNIAGQGAAAISAGSVAGVAGTVTAALGLAANVAGKYASGKVPIFSQTGVTGGPGALIGTPGLYADFRRVVDADPTRLGRPLMSRRVISSLSGFVVCDNPAIDLPATSTEASQVIAHMASGFYFE